MRLPAPAHQPSAHQSGEQDERHGHDPAFGGEQWHKAFALAVGLQAFVDALHRDPGHGAVMLVAQPEADPVPALRGTGIRLPGSS